MAIIVRCIWLHDKEHTGVLKKLIEFINTNQCKASFVLQDVYMHLDDEHMVWKARVYFESEDA